MCSPSAPDTSGMNAAAVSQAAMGQEQLAWAKQIYGETAPDRAAAIVRSNRVADSQITAMDTQTALAQDYNDYNKSTFRPLEQNIVQSAQAYDTPERRAAARDTAMADVEQQLTNQRGITARNMERSGVNPNSGQAIAASNQMAISGAAMQSNAAYKAGKDVEIQGYARKMDAVGLGKGLAGSQATSAQIATGDGSAGVNSSMASGNITAQGNQIMNSGYSGAQQGMAGSANTYGAIGGINARAAESNNAIWGAVGAVGGGLAGGPGGAAVGKGIGNWLSG